MVLRSLVKTLVGTGAQALATSTLKSVRVGAYIQADSGDTVYIGGADVSASTGFLIPTSSPISLGEISTTASGMIDLTKTYVAGGNGDVVRILYFQDDTMV